MKLSRIKRKMTFIAQIFISFLFKNKPISFTSMFLIFCHYNGTTQISIDGNIEIDATHAEDDSHYYYNEIHSQRRGWSIGFSEARLYSGYSTGKLELHFQQSLSRKLGGSNYKYQIEQLSAEISFSDDRFKVNLGRVIHPFGGFYNRQFSHQRSFLSAPLQYSYYQNISTLFGYQPSLGENGFVQNGTREWGSSSNHRYGYLNGIKLSWLSNNEKVSLDMAFGNRSSFLAPFNSPSQWEWTTRLSSDVSWAFSHGVSMRYYSFRSGDFRDLGLSSESQLNNFSQWQLGYDFKIGMSYFEINGEMAYSKIMCPLFDSESGYTLNSNEVPNQSLSSFSSHLDLKVEPPSISGLSISFRIEQLHFGDVMNQPWDHDVWRNSLIIGYKLTRNIIFRTQYSIQNVSDKAWDQNFLKAAITLHI